MANGWFHRKEGWKTVRLHDRNERPITNEVDAIAACRKLAGIYRAWKLGDERSGPHLIDKLGRPCADHPMLRSAAHACAPGTIAAIAADFLIGDEYHDLKPSTRDDYRLCLEALVQSLGRDAGTV